LIAKVMFVLDEVGSFVAQHVLREVQKLLEGEFTPVEPRAEPDDPEQEHLVPRTILRHRHLKPSGKLVSAYHDISRQQELHCTLLRINTASFRNWIPIFLLLIRKVMMVLFSSPQYPSECW
jgi:hypothetical protein